VEEVSAVDFAADNYYAHHDGTNATDEPLTDERDHWTHTTIGEAGLYGLPVITTWAACWCTNGQHALLKRDDHLVDESDVDQWLTWAKERGETAHKIHRTTVTIQTPWKVHP